MSRIKFAFSEAKALSALAFVARERPGLTAFFVSKIFYVAEKLHVNRYGRPIVADTYIAMTQGPVPSTIKNYIDGRWDWVSEPEGIRDAFIMERGRGLPKLMPGNREAAVEHLSDTDIECLREAIAFCADKSPDELSLITHQDKAWANAEANRAMDYADFIDDDNPHRNDILRMVQESAAYGVL
jgi:uncharacterized phage-associated protein